MSDIKIDTGSIHEVDQDAVAPETLRVDSMAVLRGIEGKGVEFHDKESLAKSLDTIIEEFGIENTVFDSAASALTLIAIADRHRNIEPNSALDPAEKKRELEAIADLVMLSVGPATRLAEEYKKTSDVSGLSDEAARSAYERFTQPELSAEMKAYIHGPAFDALRKRLGKDVRMDDFDVRVLSVASREDAIAYGLIPSVDWDGLIYEEAQRLHDERREYEEGLYANGEKFKQAMGRETNFAPAWVNTDDEGKKTLFIPSATAEKILYPDEERAAHYSERDRLDDISTLEHEFVHTQGMLLFGGRIGLGIALEELRAEHFSGDKHGYIDIKKFFMGMSMVTGYTPKKAFERDGASYDEERFMLDIVSHVGLDGLLDTLTAVPINYVQAEHANPHLKAMVEHNGNGLSGLLENVYKKAIERDGQEAVEQRIDESVDKIREALKDGTISVESWFNYGGNAFLARLGVGNFRTRYPEESDNYEYSSLKAA